MFFAVYLMGKCVCIHARNFFCPFCRTIVTLQHAVFRRQFLSRKHLTVSVIISCAEAPKRAQLHTLVLCHQKLSFSLFYPTRPNPFMHHIYHLHCTVSRSFESHPWFLDTVYFSCGHGGRKILGTLFPKKTLHPVSSSKTARVESSPMAMGSFTGVLSLVAYHR